MTRFTVALSGLADADVGCVRAALERDDLDRWQMADGPDGDALLVDVDSVWGHMDWLKAVGAGQHTIACTSQSDLRDHGMTLSTPLDADALAQTLRALEDVASGSEETKAVPARATAPEPEPEPAPEPTPEPAVSAAPVQTQASAPAAVETPPEPEPEPEPVRAATLAEALLQGRLDTAFSVSANDGTSLTVDPAAAIYVGPAQLKPLAALLALPPDQIRPMGASEAAASGPHQPLARLVWFAALNATPGELAPHLDRHTAFRLNRWPQIEREFPRHFRIATAMMKQAGTLGEIASLANTPEADVADFINAYQAVGYIDGGASESVAGTDGGMLSRLRRPFARGA